MRVGQQLSLERHLPGEESLFEPIWLELQLLRVLSLTFPHQVSSTWRLPPLLLEQLSHALPQQPPCL